MPDDGDADPTSRPRVRFADGRFTRAEAFRYRDWRAMTAYERAILDRLLEVEFPERAAVVAEAASCEVRQMDRCGCLEFRIATELRARADELEDERHAGRHLAIPDSVRDPRWIVAEGSGPSDDEGIPVEIMLTLAGEHLLWLEFHRYCGSDAFQPDPGSFQIFPHGRPFEAGGIAGS